MCVRVYNKDSGEDTDNPITFSDMLGISVKNLVVDNAYNQLIPESCLCQVNCEASCEKAGFYCVENDDFDLVIWKKTVEEKINEISKHR